MQHSQIKPILKILQHNSILPHLNIFIHLTNDEISMLVLKIYLLIILFVIAAI